MTDFSGSPFPEQETLAPGPARGRYSPRIRGGATAYRAARRHSALVRSLRFILPALAVAGVAAFWGTARFAPSDVLSLLNIAGVDLDKRAIIMDDPHLSGFEGTRRSYDVTADTAMQSLDDPKLITLNGIVGHFGFGDGTTATVKAKSGLYDARTSQLSLTEGVAATTTDGYTADLVDASVDVDLGRLATDKPVVLTSSEGTIRANGMTVLDSGKHVLFTGGVSVTYRPPPSKVAVQP
jgi:lipopolysaccharide export system protein LptC